MFFRILGEESAGDLARRLLVSAVKLTLTVDEVASGLAHTVEGISTAAVREEAPEKTGDLKNSLRGQVERSPGAFLVSMTSDVPYASYVQHGTGIYATPEPHAAWDVVGFQHFLVDGRDIYTQHTHHEGQKPDDYVGRGMARAEAPIHAALHLAGEQILVSFGAGL